MSKRGNLPIIILIFILLRIFAHLRFEFCPSLSTPYNIRATTTILPIVTISFESIFILIDSVKMRFSPLLRSTQVLIRSATGNPTGLTGILTHPNPRPVLIELYKSTLNYIEDSFPKDAVYRTSTTNFTTKRLEIVEKHEDITKIESEIGNGLIEELIIQANDEFNLAQKLAEWKVWEELEEKPLEDQWVYFGKRI
ncbi:NADH dehydrogenase [ubiquinone] 1 alpha subcomplex subunit 5 [Wickerhamomyces ciferrii]|uniref:NADH dehydrogenase [ubiquinone] 1 alpha subcomplex subunit 5 n=1 Tax=Wickerhamomyces ciferrii (strain ATCC 14091 / BCRC 22168 / CBS 111 / JCM 3599 / NBRC 0793 / NRRL Y-1031 F-60-10) TaxID=1206466 RepID=K0KLP1_WICCF|nr:NADH dehydrogenase [ubiquinone] 1 alpha subcomplex subunit 5 [Wickerhamomyces ciferrii]CCH43901.1 NADH dehydrogenase [ubiquinone] 1 alpha subcomplex subunit 5 [Wickerhamomyces ciferrii]